MVCNFLTKLNKLGLPNKLSLLAILGDSVEMGIETVDELAREGPFSQDLSLSRQCMSTSSRHALQKLSNRCDLNKAQQPTKHKYQALKRSTIDLPWPK